ncbi:MAG TPA: hypothetical protein VMK12_07905 [Anaeromyxobacteraceae bacterium]|nr:hypothetical protein [Anaeromyxobacteraceae bacterium]
MLAARTPSCPDQRLGGGQGSTRIIHFGIDVKSWVARVPTVDEARPGQCPVCGSASRPAGGGIVLHGHGLRVRDQWGPPDATAPPVVIEVVGRRYECQECGAVLLVVPGGILRRRLYSAAAIALALAVWSLEEKAPAEVRARVSPWRLVGATAAEGWASLRRWAKAVRGGRLFPVVRALPGEVRLRQVAARAATTLAALVPSSLEGLPLTTRAMLGAAHVI